MFKDETANSFLRDVCVIPIVITESKVTNTNVIIIMYEEGSKLKINRGINFCTVDKKKIIGNVADVIIDTNHPWNGARPNFIAMASSIITDREGIVIIEDNKEEKINHKEATLCTKKYFKLFSKDINIPSPIRIGINTIMFSSRLTQRANQLELQLEIRRLANSISFNRLTDEKYIIGIKHRI